MSKESCSGGGGGGGRRGEEEEPPDPGEADEANWEDIPQGEDTREAGKDKAEEDRTNTTRWGPSTKLLRRLKGEE